MRYIGENEDFLCGAKCKAEAEALKVNAQAALIGAQATNAAVNQAGSTGAPASGSDNTMVYVIVGVVVLIIAVVTIIIIKKKRG